jgi:hypothetical protein
MRLEEKDGVSLSSICRAVEQRLSHVPCLSKLNLPVVLADFEKEFPERPWLWENPAGYCRGRILVNKQVFLRRPAMAVLVHEIAHAYCDLIDPGLRAQPMYGDLPKDCLADLLVCQWGFEEELVSDRLPDPYYGQEYCEALRSWRNEKDYVDLMKKYCRKHCDPMQLPLDG